MITENQVLRGIVFNTIVVLVLMSVAFLSMLAVPGGNTIINYAATGSLQQPEHQYNPLEQMGITLILIMLKCSSAGLLLFILLEWFVGNVMLFNVELESAYVACPKITKGVLAAVRAYSYERHKP